MNVLGTVGPVRIVGTGLLGTSIGLALRAGGVDVVLSDPSPTTVAVAQDVGAGRVESADDAEPALVVVAAPPDVTARVVAAELAQHPQAVVTDVASVKGQVWAELVAAGADLSRYVGSHPMAGRERSGPVAAVPDLFFGRPWVICTSGETADGQEAGDQVADGQAGARALQVVRTLAIDLGAMPVTMDTQEHDAAVALVSHVPQIVSTVLAARLLQASPAAVGLAGQGLRDVTRIAASDPGLWTSILAANAPAVTQVLGAVRSDLDEVLGSLSSWAQGQPSSGALAQIARTLVDGNAGVARIPGKHGGAARTYAQLSVLVPDEPGSLAALLTLIGEIGVNLEDLDLDHAAGRLVGVAQLFVLPEVAAHLEQELTVRGWKVVP